MAKNKTPPKHAQNIQYDLFSKVLANTTSDLSNSIYIWERIPKYFFTAHLIDKLRKDDGHADPYTCKYKIDGVVQKAKIFPAQIEQKDGSYKSFFPSVTEELIEEVLKKVFTDPKQGVHSPKNNESWVKFSLSLLRKELKLRGKSRSISEIKHAIEVMSGCIIVIYHNDKEFWKGVILQDLITVGRIDYLADTKAYHAARLPLFISQSINKLEYRQFNYDRLMQCSEQLTRWIYKRIINRYTYANLKNTYHFMYSDLKLSGLLEQSREVDNRKKVIRALDELIKRGALSSYLQDIKKEGRAIVDVKYTVFTSAVFVTEQTAANARNKNNIAIYENVVHKKLK